MDDELERPRSPWLTLIAFVVIVAVVVSIVGTIIDTIAHLVLVAVVIAAIAYLLWRLVSGSGRRR